MITTHYHPPGISSFFATLSDGGGSNPTGQVEEVKVRLLHFWLRDPIENSHLFRVKTFTEAIVEARGVGNRNWHWPRLAEPVHIQQWHHFCVAYSSVTRRLVMVHNGMLEVEHTRPEMVGRLDDFVPSQWFGRVQSIYSGALVMKKQGIQGSFTDFNVWDSFLAEREMRRFTMCEEEVRGGLLAWDGDDWQMTPGIEEAEYSVVEQDWTAVCSPPSNYIIFPERIVWLEALQLCGQFRGRMVVTDREEDYTRLTSFLIEYEEPPTWLRFTDASSEGTWVDYKTQKEPHFPIPWLHISEPTGFIGEVLLVSICYRFVFYP